MHQDEGIEEIAEDIAEDFTEVVQEDIWGIIKEVLDWGLHLGEGEQEVHITLGLLLLVTVSFIGTTILLRWIRRISTRKMNEPDKAKFLTFFQFIRYIVYIIVVFAVMSFAGINVTPFLASLAALLVGVGLAMQEIFQDIIGGILNIIDKSLLVGDIIEIDGKVGQVAEINLRTTRIITRDDKVMVIPNHMFIRNPLLNYTQNHKMTRENVSVGVAYGSDTALVKKLLLESLQVEPRVRQNPEPFVAFEEFADSSLRFSVYFFIDEGFAAPGIKSEIRFEIDRLFREHDVTIPFPQRDVHMIPPE